MLPNIEGSTSSRTVLHIIWGYRGDGRPPWGGSEKGVKIAGKMEEQFTANPMDCFVF